MYTNEQLIEFCQEAVRIPSYSGQEKGVAEFMKRKMEEYGFDEVIIDKYGSVLGTINGKRPGKTILMDGHIDTVDVIDVMKPVYNFKADDETKPWTRKAAKKDEEADTASE